LTVAVHGAEAPTHLRNWITSARPDFVKPMGVTDYDAIGDEPKSMV
jgi:hypothetical protein